MGINKLFIVNPEKGKLLIFTLIVFLLSFPKIDSSYGTGVDFSLPFAFNYFSCSDIHFGRDVIFTYGPLSFLKMPVFMENNLILGICFFSISYFVFIYSSLFLGNLINKKRWLLHIGSVFLACNIIYLDTVLIGITALSLLIHHENKNKIWLMLAVLNSLIGLYIKSSIGIGSLFLLFSYTLCHYLLFRNYKKPLVIAGIIMAGYFFLWMLIYHDLQGACTFLWATYELARENSSAASLYPENNWLLLSTSIISFLSIPFVTKNNKVFLLYAMFFLSAFAAWKHSYTREEEVHLQVFYHFLILFFFMFIIFIDKIKTLHIVLMAISLITLYGNMLFTEHYHQNDSIRINNITNFYNVFFQYDKFVEKSLAVSIENIHRKKLPEEILSIIDSASVDIYPWDFSYIAANNLNWKPRPVIQSYAAYTEWLDEQDAQYFSSEKRAQYILWELTDDRYGQKGFCSIDSRYLLNDEPNALYQLFNNYKPIYKNKQIILFKKNTEQMLRLPKSIRSDTAVWNQWIKVPAEEDGIIRVKTKFSKTIFGRIKELLYKAEEIRIDCRMKSDEVIQYRVIPNCAERGIWINPHFVGGMDRNMIHLSEVDAIRFTCSDIDFMQEEIVMHWESISINKKQVVFPSPAAPDQYKGKYKNTFGYFMQYFISTDTLVFHSLNDFESEKGNWLGNTKNLSSENIFSGKKSEMLDTNDIFSSTFTVPIEIMNQEVASFTVSAAVWVKMTGNAGGSLVISVENDKEAIYWKAKKLEEYVIDRSQWYQVYFNEKITSLRNCEKLKIYIINNQKAKIWIDNFEIKIFRSH